MSILDLEPIASWRVDGTVKGFPGARGPLALRDIGAQRWNVLAGDVPLPAALLKRSALEGNRRWMRRFLEASGVRIAPHGKTTMSPQLFEMQLEDGAWGMTCASVEQLQVYRQFGVERVLMANQLVGRANVEYVVSELKRDPKFEFHCLVDSVDGVRHLAAQAASFGPARPIRVLVELGAAGGRTGVRTSEDALAVAREVSAQRGVVALAGVETYERIVPAGGTAQEFEARVQALLAEAAKAARAIDDAGLFDAAGPVLFSAGGSDYFDLAASRIASLKLSRPTLPIIRSGCYLTLDHVTYAQAFIRIYERGLPQGFTEPPPAPALEVWGYLQSRPESTRAFVSLGKRDVSYDLHLPVPFGWVRPGDGGVRPFEGAARVTGLNDQHAYLELPSDSPLRVGDMVGLGIAHPCTTFDKWQLIYVVDDDYRIVDAIRTFF